MENDFKSPLQTYYELGYADATDASRQRKRAVPRTYRLTYVCGWYDAKNKKSFAVRLTTYVHKFTLDKSKRRPLESET